MKNLFKDVLPQRMKIDGTNFTIAAGTGDTLASDWISVQDFQGIAIIGDIGTMTATATLDAKLQYSTDGGSTSAGDIAGSALPQMLAASMSLKQFGWDQLELAPNITHVRVSLTRATANVVLLSMHAYLYHGRKKPVTLNTGAGQFSSTSFEFNQGAIGGTA